MISPSALFLLLLFLSYPGLSYGCRVSTIDPLPALSGSDETIVFPDVFVGEIVGVRNPDRLEDLRRCRPPVMKQQEDGVQILDCIEADFDLVLEVYPTQVLKGNPQFPASLVVSHCSVVAPRVGSQALVLQSSTRPSIVLVSSSDDPDYPYTYDEHYLRTIQLCILGECPEGESQ